MSGGIVGYTSPPPDLPGTTNLSALAGDLPGTRRLEQDGRGLLNDGDYGVDVLLQKDVPSYGIMQ